uniref:Uncharacterized protein n=1 Tax=Nomascus leucogenys TaxID=61853 RepID=A0A2I3HD78_NOMLE
MKGGTAHQTCAFHSRSSVLTSLVITNDPVSDSLSVEGCFELQESQLTWNLRNLELTCGYLLEEDLRCLYQYPSLAYPKHLNLSYMLHLEPLGALLEKVSATLETLILEGCQIHYSQLSAILPCLSRCSQLTTFYFGRNCMSMDALKDLLRHTSALSKLSLETYPAPEESLNSLVRVSWEIFTPLGAELMCTLREVRQPKRIFIGPTPCPSCDSSPPEELELHLCC